MGLFSGIGTAIGAAFGMPMVGMAVGGALDANRAAKEARAAGNQQLAFMYEQLEQAKPRDVYGGAGGISFDPSTRDVSVDLDPRYSAMLDQLLGRREGYQDIVAEYTGDPIQQAMELAQERTALRRPQQEEDRLALEARLFEQGRLGSTGGAGQQQALEESFRRQELIDEQQALGDVMDIGKTYRGYEATDMASMFDLEKLPTNLYSGLATAGRVTPSAGFATAQTSAATAGQRASDLGMSQLGGMIGNTFGSSGLFGGNSMFGDNNFSTSWGSDATTADFYAPW